MSQIQPSAWRSVPRPATWLSAAAALIGLALAMTAAVPAQAATTAAAAQVAAARIAAARGTAAGFLARLSAIRVNTLNWTASAGFGSRHPAWYTDRSGIVHLQGAVSQTSAAGSGADLIGTLPAAARPSTAVYTIVHTFGGTSAGLEISTAGQILILQPPSPAVTDLSFVSLEAISYRR